MIHKSQLFRVRSFFVRQLKLVSSSKIYVSFLRHLPSSSLPTYHPLFTRIILIEKTMRTIQRSLGSVSFKSNGIHGCSRRGAVRTMRQTPAKTRVDKIYRKITIRKTFATHSSCHVTNILMNESRSLRHAEIKIYEFNLIRFTRIASLLSVRVAPDRLTTINERNRIESRTQSRR